MSGDIQFRRINGRIIPIRKKTNLSGKDILNASAVAVGIGASAASGVIAAKQFKQSYKAYNVAAHARGVSKLLFARKIPVYTEALEAAARSKVFAKGISKRAVAVALAGSTAGSYLAGLGGLGLVKDRTDQTTAFSVSAGLGLLGSGLGLAILAKKAKVGHVATAFKAVSPQQKVGEAFSMWNMMGQRKSSNLIAKYSAMAEKAKIKKVERSLKVVSKKVKKVDPNQMKLF